jgi:UPF0755 protein
MGIGFVVLLALTVGIFVAAYPQSAGPGPGRPVEVDYEGEGVSAFADKLVELGLVRNARYFKVYVWMTGGTSSFVRGVHLVTDEASPRELVHRFERRGAAHAKIVIPEGWTRYDIAKRLDAAHVCTLRRFLEATENAKLVGELHLTGDTAEGFLFPATYDLELDSDPTDIVRQMVHLFDKRWAALETQHDPGLKELSDSLGWGKRQVVILASMIEKEAAVDDERGIIASVFLNRLRDPSFKPHGRLQSDPTSGYGCLALYPPPPSCASYTGKITRDINMDETNTYSTYTHDGLPPGPICNPGARSIEAVMSPALTHYFFFVAKGGGRHTFSETLPEHNSAVHAPYAN